MDEPIITTKELGFLLYIALTSKRACSLHRLSQMAFLLEHSSLRVLRQRITRLSFVKASSTGVVIWYQNDYRDKLIDFGLITTRPEIVDGSICTIVEPTEDALEYVKSAFSENELMYLEKISAHYSGYTDQALDRLVVNKDEFQAAAWNKQISL